MSIEIPPYPLLVNVNVGTFLSIFPTAKLKMERFELNLLHFPIILACIFESTAKL